MASQPHQENVHFWNGTDKLVYLDTAGTASELPPPHIITTVGKQLFKQCPDDPSCVITASGQHVVIDPAEPGVN